jgi:hypothetical protein
MGGGSSVPRCKHRSYDPKNLLHARNTKLVLPVAAGGGSIDNSSSTSRSVCPDLTSALPRVLQGTNCPYGDHCEYTVCDSSSSGWISYAVQCKHMFANSSS